MKLNILSNNRGAKKTGKRVGRGIGSGVGKTCGRGVKGQKSRSGVAINGFEGGQTSLIKRLAKRGFNCPTTTKHEIINLQDIINLIQSSRITGEEVITKEVLVQFNIIKNAKLRVKLLANCRDPLNHKLQIKLDAYSASAKTAIENAGGNILSD